MAALLDGMPPARATLFAALAVSTGAALLAWHFRLAVRHGPGPTLAAGALGLLAIVVGGTGLSRIVWPVVPWSWAISGQPSSRALICIPAALLLAAVGLLVTRAAAGRHR